MAFEIAKAHDGHSLAAWRNVKLFVNEAVDQPNQATHLIGHASVSIIHAREQAAAKHRHNRHGTIFSQPSGSATSTSMTAQNRQH
jgi:hypothetical protein